MSIANLKYIAKRGTIEVFVIAFSGHERQRNVLPEELTAMTMAVDRFFCFASTDTDIAFRKYVVETLYKPENREVVRCYLASVAENAANANRKRDKIFSVHIKIKWETKPDEQEKK